ncbi:MAG: TonB-dependent receptor, partial [Gammaproteobacteria bacterium]
GLSVYVNGVRFNEPFGDTVNWDLIPEGAIDQMALHPGSNPVYGLNSLGGAISIKTKTGFTAPGHRLEAFGGSWDRHSEEFSSGWNNGTVGYFFDIRNFGEQGWRDFSRSGVKQGLGTLSWQGDKGALDLTVAANDNDLKGNGAVPIQLHKIDRKAIFTHPDQTITRLFLASLDGSYSVTDAIEASANVYYRRNKIRTFNGDDSDFEECLLGANAGLLCEEPGVDEEVVVDIDGNNVLAGDAVEGATNNTSQTVQRSHGGSLQLAFNNDIFDFGNQLVVGASYDHADVHFESDTELAELTDDRGTAGSGVLVEESRVRLNSKVKSYGLYYSDTFSVTDDLAVNVAGRYNHTEITLSDRFGDELNGHHSFYRFNPSYGATYTIIPNLTAYGSYGESSRAPTPMELSCADPDAPCKLPNSFVSDPPLDQVVAKTWEGGLRGYFDDLLGASLRWNAGIFHTVNHDDIIFNRGGDSISEGFFSNVGKTRRRGVEAGLALDYDGLFGNIDVWRLSANYTYLNAEFRDRFVIQNPRDPDDPAGVQVKKGDRIPGLPEHIFKFAVDVDLWRSWSLGIEGLYNGDRYFRGDEANVTGALGGYWVFNVRSEYRINEHLALFGKIDNVFDRDYKSFGVYGEAEEVLGSEFDDGRFVSPGAPRAGWIGIKLSL